MNANMPAIEFEIDRLHKLAQEKDAEVARLREALETVVSVASGERQVADDDTGGMAWIDRFARAALNSGTTR